MARLPIPPVNLIPTPPYLIHYSTKLFKSFPCCPVKFTNTEEQVSFVVMFVYEKIPFLKSIPLP